VPAASRHRTPTDNQNVTVNGRTAVAGGHVTHRTTRAVLVAQKMTIVRPWFMSLDLHSVTTAQRVCTCRVVYRFTYSGMAVNTAELTITRLKWR